MTIKDVLSDIVDETSHGFRTFCSETDIEMIRGKSFLMGSFSAGFNSLFLLCVVDQFLAARGIDINSRALEPFAVILTLFLVILTGGQIVLALFAMECGPYGQHSRKRQIYKVGCFYKSLADVGALAIALKLRYLFEMPLCFFWISSVAVLQILWKLRYGPCDFWFSDVILGSIMRAVMVCQDYDDSVLMALYLFYGLIIYHRHWCSPSSVTTFSKFEDVLQNQEPTVVEVQNQEPTVVEVQNQELDGLK